MDAATLEVIETDHAASLALRREVVAGPEAHVDVVMVPPGGEIGAETHADADETLLVLAGAGEAVVDGERLPVRAGSVVYIPRGTRHNVHNRGPATLRLYAVHAATA
jgi:mannose-6-phosphate isomerase-like protein (cupin superfamily)